ncbi:MAG: hypothetical protein QNJ41_12520, partial [Xenococcaceae cyanobacterium MO_188.B32]|nr:hypothetical protein [Xenococcaceae cyanobacterium MO_188.B32]
MSEQRSQEVCCDKNCYLLLAAILILKREEEKILFFNKRRKMISPRNVERVRSSIRLIETVRKK